MTLLSIDNLSIYFGDSHVVRDLSLQIARGEIVAVVGESGSGKSLTASAILKLLPGNAATQGTIRFEGETLSDKSEADIAQYRGNRIGMIFQEPMSALNPLHTIQRQVIEPYCIHHRISRHSPQAHQRLTELMGVVGLGHLVDRGTLYPHQLSGGERQRAMIAMAIANDPALLIADEPTTALDVTLQRQILDLLKSLQAQHGMGMLFITHDLPMVRAFADRVYVLREGKVVETGSVDAIFTHAQHPYTQLLLASAPHGTAAPIAPDAAPLLETDALTVAFPIKSPLLRRTRRETRAVDQVSLTLRTGETLGIVGESGSGKTSLCLAILRLIKSTGPIVFLGDRLDMLDRRHMRPLRRAMQLVFQDPYGSLNPRMTVGELVAEGLRVHAAPSRGKTSQEISDAVDAILLQVGLTTDMKHRYPHEFSGGQRQRIAIARAMILKPKLVVLDEPTSALDMTVQKQVLDLLRTLQIEHGVSYLLISHDLRVIRAVSHQVLVLKAGRMVEQGPAEALFQTPQHPYTQALFNAAFDA